MAKTKCLNQNNWYILPKSEHMTSNKCISDMTNADSGKIAQSVAKFDDEN